MVEHQDMGSVIGPMPDTWNFPWVWTPALAAISNIFWFTAGTLDILRLAPSQKARSEPPMTGEKREASMSAIFGAVPFWMHCR